MTATLSPDPLTLSEQELWSALERHQPLAALVSVANRISCVNPDNDNPFNRPTPQAGDLPELVLVPISTEYPQATSTSFMVAPTWQIAIHTDKWRTGVEGGINQVQFHVSVAVWRLAMLGARDIGGHRMLFTMPANAAQSIGNRVGFNTTDQNAVGVRGWMSLVTVRAQIVVGRQYLETAP